MSVERRTILGVVTVLFLFGAFVRMVAGSAPLTIKVAPAYMIEPVELRATATVEPDAANRALVVECDSGDYYRSSYIQLDGRDAPRTHTVRWPHLGAGIYRVRATLAGPGGKVLSVAHGRATVIGPRGSE